MGAVKDRDPNEMRLLETERYEREIAPFKAQHDENLRLIDQHERTLLELEKRGLLGNGNAHLPSRMMSTETTEPSAMSPIMAVRSAILLSQGDFDVHAIERIIQQRSAEVVTLKQISRSLHKLIEGGEVIQSRKRRRGHSALYKVAKLRTDLMDQAEASQPEANAVTN
jgi:hypothetical protein